jgi:ribosomal protein S18 acetylase RimI-like enzyme
LDTDYFNYRRYTAEGWWDRRTFLHKWWQLQARDRRWVPPLYSQMWQALVSPTHEYLATQPPLLLHLEALARRRQGTATPLGSPSFSGAWMEEPVAVAGLLTGRAAAPDVAYLALLHAVNHVETMERFWGELLEVLWGTGRRRLLGPTGLSPVLPSGALQNYFHVTPPLHSPYNPPYLPEVLESVMKPTQEFELHHVTIPEIVPEMIQVESDGLHIEAFAPQRLAQDLLPLFVAGVQGQDDAGPPDAAEVSFVLDWLRSGPLYGWLASAGGVPVGFVLLQPDLAPSVRWAGGGRNWAWRLWLAWRRRQPVRAGRLLYGGVFPAWRRQGIGRRLWQQGLALARQLGWHSLTIGPVITASAAAHFLRQQGAEPRQRYLLYGGDL